MTKTRKLTGVSLSDAKNQYLAYHEGQVGYLKGSYKRKQWLINKANNVGNRSSKYKDNFQLVSGLEEINFFGALFPVEY